MPLQNSIFIGWDAREAAAFAVAQSSCRRHLNIPIPIYGLVLSDLQREGVYTRPIEYRQSAADRPVMWDVVSDFAMATEFACSRFFVPMVAKTGWALFCDCDMLFRANVGQMMQKLDSTKAVYVVKHNYKPTNEIKMDGQVQSNYGRKLWSSFCIFNCDHPANKALTLEVLNNTPGRDLHALFWLKDSEIGELGEEWNWIPGHSPDTLDPKCVHFSEGGPWFPGYEDVPFAKEWNDSLNDWARGALSFGA